MNKCLFFQPLLIIISSTLHGQLKPYIDTSKYTSSATETFTIPEVPAEYPGGYKAMAKFIMDRVNKLSISNSEAETFQTPVVTWVIDDKGNVTNVKMLQTSNVSIFDTALIQIIQKMPKWMPARFKGKNVGQEFRFPLRIHFR